MHSTFARKRTAESDMTERHDTALIDIADTVGDAMASAFFGYGYWFRTGVPAGWST